MKFAYLMLSCLLLITSSIQATAQDWALATLDASPRHHEFIEVPSGDKKLNCFIVYPEVKEKATSVVVIHEIFGLSDWVRSVADQLAEAGYIAIAPDLLSGMGENQLGTPGFSGRDCPV